MWKITRTRKKFAAMCVHTVDCKGGDKPPCIIHCGKSWSGATKAQAELLRSVHITQNELHDVKIKELI